MKIRNISRVLLIIISSLWLSYGCHANDNFKKPDRTLIMIEGIITIKGSEPNTYVNLKTTNNINYAIVGGLKEKLQNFYQYKTVKLEGEVVKEAIGPVFPAKFLAHQLK